MNSDNKIVLEKLSEENMALVSGGAVGAVCPKFKVGDKVSAAYSCKEFEMSLSGVVSVVKVYNDGVSYDLKDCYGYYNETRYNGEPIFNVAEYMLSRP